MIRIDTQHFLIMLLGQLKFLLLQVRGGEVEMGSQMVGVVTQGLPVLSNRLVRIALQEIDIAPIGVRVGAAGIEGLSLSIQ